MTKRTTRTRLPMPDAAKMRAGRWEFVGVKAPERIRKKYVGRYVGDQFRQGGRDPVRYVNA